MSTITYELSFKTGTPKVTVSDGVETFDFDFGAMPSAWAKFFYANLNPENSRYSKDLLTKVFLWAKSNHNIESPFVPVIYKDIVFGLDFPKNLLKDQVLYDSWVCQMVRSQVRNYSSEVFDWIDLIAQASEYCANKPQSFNTLWKKLRIVKGELYFNSAFRVEENSAISCGQLTLGSLLHSSLVAPLECKLSELSTDDLVADDGEIVLQNLSLLQGVSSQIEMARHRIYRMYSQTSQPLVPANMQVVPLDRLPQATLQLEEQNANTPLYQLLFAA